MPDNLNSLLNTPFVPDTAVEKQYKAQITALLKSEVSSSAIIDMGMLPHVYTALGIADKQLKTNGTTILKALGIKGKNNHTVPMNTVVNLLSLTCNPEAVFKSLSTSDNPDAYIAVLNAKTEKQEHIIAILSPSKDGQGFTFIPSVYERHNFNRFLEKTYKEQKVLYIKNKGSELWGRLQLPPRHNSEPSYTNILTKNDIVKRFLQKQEVSASYEAEINNKEQSMSDVNEKTTREFTPEETAAFNGTLHQREIILEALKKGTLSCLPGDNGLADTKPAVSLMTGDYYHGKNMLYLKEHQKLNGFPTGEYITEAQIEKAKLENPDISLRGNQKSANLHFSELNQETGKWDKKVVQLYNVGQTTDPRALKNWVSEQQQKKEDRIRHIQSESFTESKPKQQHSDSVITCSSTDPEKYLGQYLAAVSLGAQFKVSPEQAKEFSQKFETSLEKKLENGYPDPFKLSKISNFASEHCKEAKKEFYANVNKQNQEQKNEQSHSMGR